MARYAKLARTTPHQTEPLDPKQVKNNAGGYAYAVDDWTRLDRFLVLGSDTNTYYQTAPALTRESSECVQRCYDQNHLRTIQRIVEVSVGGRAPKNDPAIFALALGASHKDVQVRQAALLALLDVCRTSTHLFQFLENCKALGKGWGRALKNAVARWYDSRSVMSVAYQAIKYRSREGWDHSRTLRLARWRNKGTEDRVALYKWMKGEPCNEAVLPPTVRAHILAMETGKTVAASLPQFPELDLPGLSLNLSAAQKEKARPKLIAKLMEEFKLPFEAVPKEVQNAPEIWRAALPELGGTALIRNLARMTSYGVLKPLASETKAVCEKLTDVEFLRKGRIHPFNVLVARAQYASGRSQFKGRKADGSAMSWEPVPQVSAALEEAFYLSFQTIEPSNKRTMVALDVSGSMTWVKLMGTQITPRDGAAAMAMTVLRTEPQCFPCAFADTFRNLPLTPKMSLEQVMGIINRQSASGTDCAQPMLYALKQGLEVDVFQVYTDSETYAGAVHPVTALKRYRDKTGINAKLIVVGMVSNGFTIADPDDPGMLDVVGFDTAAPAVMTEFARG